MRFHYAGILTWSFALTLLGTAPAMAESVRYSDAQNGQTPSAVSGIVVDTDSTVTLTVNGTAVGELLEDQVRTLDVIPGDQVVQYDRDIRVELQKAFEQLRAAGLASVDDEERLAAALIGSLSEWVSSAEFQTEFDRMNSVMLCSSSKGFVGSLSRASPTQPDPFVIRSLGSSSAEIAGGHTT